MESLESKMESIDLESEMDSIACEVCFHQFDENTNAPRTLNCGHSLCTECIGKGISNGQIICPFCRKEHNAISANVIPISYTLLKVVKALEKIEANYLRKVEKQDGDTRLSPHVAIEPQLHAGVCDDHGSYNLFWCTTCNVWVCRDCTVLDHPTSTCSIMSIRKAFTSIKEEGNKSIYESQRKRKKHISALKNHMSALLKRKKAHINLLEELQKLMEDIITEITDLEDEYERVNSSICSSYSINEKMVYLNNQLADTLTTDELMLLKTETQGCRESVENWIEISQKELESRDFLKKTEVRHTVVNWALRFGKMKTVNIEILQYLIRLCIQEAVSVGVVTVSSLTQLDTKLIIYTKPPTGFQVSLVTQDKRGVHLHTACVGYPPMNNLELPYLEMKKLMSNPMGFITVECKGKLYGPVYFTMDSDCPEIEDILHLLDGEGSNRRLINSKLSKIQSDFYLDDSGTPSKRTYNCFGITMGAISGKQGRLEELLENLPKVTKNISHSMASSDATNNEVSEKGLCGWVTLNHNRGEVGFTIWYEEEQDLFYRSERQVELHPKMGKVVEGIETIRELTKQISSHDTYSMQVVDCGMYCQSDS